MRAAAHDPAMAKRLGIPMSVAREYVKADRKKAQMTKRKKRY